MNTLRTRLLLALLALLAVAMLVIGGLTYQRVRAETEELFDYQLRQMALTLRDQGEFAPDQASALADADIDFVVQIWSIDGRAIFASRHHAELPSRALLGLAEIRTGSETWRTFSVATPLRVIQVAQPVRVRSRLAAAAALRAVAPLMVLAPLMALVMGWAVTRALAPLRHVAAGLRERNALLLDPLPTQDLPDEVAPLVAALNALLQRLGQSFDTQRAFVADAAHELRSPLTALKLQLHLVRRATDDATRAEALDTLASGIDRATRLVEQLLALTRSEPGAAPVPASDVDLSALSREAIADVVPLAHQRGTTLTLDAPAPVPLRGDAAALRALVRNLADNAVRYAPRQAEVRMRVICEGARPVVQVDDNGPGIPVAERGRVFDRFYRHASSHEEGTGLGLAIVRSVARQHGAEVALDDSPLGGLRVTVRFPGESSARHDEFTQLRPSPPGTGAA